MARKQRKKRPPLEFPPHLLPDYDHWGSPEEEAKRKALNEWLDVHDMTGVFYFEWMPAYLAERRRLAGIPPSPPARRRGPLPDHVLRELAELEREAGGDG